MKTKISTLFVGLGIAASSLMTTGCIEETFPTSGATQDQIDATDKATDALLWAMPAYLNTPVSLAGNHYEWGYGAMMHIRDVLTADYAVVASGYDWFAPWATNQGQGESYARPQYIWNFYWESVLTTNKLLSSIDEENATTDQLGLLGVGHAFRAMYYLDLAQMFEFLPNDKTSNINAAGNDVLNLTVPIVRESMTEAEARNNPRVSRDSMAMFILEDLNKAEQFITYSPVNHKALPNLACVYGLKARCYMWLAGDGTGANANGYFTQAKDYARKAINLGGTPMTKDQCLSTTEGFNDISCWMWGSQMVDEDDCVKTGIINWTSWMSNETDFGYASAGAYGMIDASLYDRIADTDFRKLMFMCPDRTLETDKEGNYTGKVFTKFGGEIQCLTSTYAENTPDYGSLKFRPAKGGYATPNEGAVSAYPLMRVEEMYFIEAEAAAHLGEGAALLNDFMTLYRDRNYTCMATTVEDIVNEVVLQKRIEFYGEGVSFFDYKRLNMSVTRGYAGTNHQDAARFNTAGRPAWMNLAIVQTEKNNNSALVGYENPDPSSAYTPWTGQ